MTDPVADRDTNSSLKGFRCRKPLVSRGHLQWTMEGWVGSVLGATVWLVVFAVALALDGRFGLACVPATACSVHWDSISHPLESSLPSVTIHGLHDPVELDCPHESGRARLPALQLRSSSW